VQHPLIGCNPHTPAVQVAVLQVAEGQSPAEQHCWHTPPQFIVPAGQTQLVPEHTPPEGQLTHLSPQHVPLQQVATVYLVQNPWLFSAQQIGMVPPGLFGPQA
jgi:hypothetical protein